LLIAWTTVAVVSLVLHGHYLRYHFLPLWAPLGILGASAIHSTCLGWRSRRTLVQTLILAVVAGALLVPAKNFHDHVTFTRQVLTSGRARDRYEDVGAYLRARTTPQDSIFVWGNAPGIYFHAGRRAASRFSYTLYLTIPFRGLPYRDTFLSEFAASRPKYFVLLKEPRPWSSLVCVPLPSQVGAYYQFPELRRIIDSEYLVEQDSNRSYTIFRRKDAPAPAATNRGSTGSAG